MSIQQLLQSDKALVMGILNVTPDSFSDGGQFDCVDLAVDHALAMQRQGADIIDIGGESTRPGAEAVSTEAELERVIPVIRSIREQSTIPVSIDTSKPKVMRAAAEAGADMVNDVNALQAEGAVETCAALNVPVCLMHMQGKPRTMQQSPEYEDVVREVKEFLQQRTEACLQAGIRRQQIVIDPGFGFGKTLEHNISLFNQLDAICELDLPVLVGISRKSMLGAIVDKPVEQRLAASIAAAVLAWSRGARIFRVHDVAETVDALKVCSALINE